MPANSPTTCAPLPTSPSSRATPPTWTSCASDYCLDFTKLEYGQHPAKDPMKHVKDHLETKKNVRGVHVLIGAFMETFWSQYFGVFDAKECKLSFYGSGDESIHQIADEFAEVHGKRPVLERRGSLEDLYNTMQAAYQKGPTDVYAYLALFYQYYCTNGQTYLKQDLDNSRYPHVKLVMFKSFMPSRRMEALSG
ncbi:hypothetical protein LQW54_002515 [Pestalotiopsis sp. IQ-011]